MKLNTVQPMILSEKVEKLFDRAAKAWVNGNNSGNSVALRRGEARCDKLRAEAEALLAPLGIKCDYPGLYPSFTVKGFAEYSVINAVSAALDRNAPVAA